MVHRDGRPNAVDLAAFSQVIIARKITARASGLFRHGKAVGQAVAIAISKLPQREAPRKYGFVESGLVL